MVTCPYCKREARLVTGHAIFPYRPELSQRYFWRCEPCGAHVGCHQAGNGQGDGTKPLGRLADKALRRAKTSAHAAFDPLWKSGRRSREDAYEWLAAKLRIPYDECHIGEFDLAQCARVVAIMSKRAAK